MGNRRNKKPPSKVIKTHDNRLKRTPKRRGRKKEEKPLRVSTIAGRTPMLFYDSVMREVKRKLKQPPKTEFDMQFLKKYMI